MAGGGDFLAKIKLALEGKEQVVSGLAQTQQAVQQLTKTRVTTIFDKQGLATGKQIEETFTKLTPKTKVATSMMNDFHKALARVMIVAPVWMAFRMTLQQTFALIADGLRTWEEFDRALIKSKAVVHDATGNISGDMVQLEDTIRKFAITSGMSLTDLSTAFYKFGKVGINFQDALSGGIAAAKLAKATFGDTSTIANGLAKAYKLLGNNIDTSLSPMERQESLAGKIYYLWKNNAFETNEFTTSLTNFIPVARMANFTTDQSIALLAALSSGGVEASRGGTLLRTSIGKLVENLGKLAPALGLSVNPELESTFDILMRVLTAMSQLSKTTGVPIEAMKAIKDIFGGQIRGGQIVPALIALLPELKRDLVDLGKDPLKYVQVLNDGFKEVTNTVSGQLDILKELRKQLGEAFVKGVTGSGDFEHALTTINELMKDGIIIAGELGKALFIMTHPFIAAKNDAEEYGKELDTLRTRIKNALAGNLPVEETIATISLIQTRFGKAIDTKKLTDSLREVAIQQTIQAKIHKTTADEAAKASAAQERTLDAQKRGISDLTIEQQDRIELSKEELKYATMQQAGISQTGIAYQKISDLINILVDRHNKLNKSNTDSVKLVDAEEIKTAAIAENYDKILSLLPELKTKQGEESKEIIKLVQRVSDYTKQRVTDTEKLINQQLQLLKIQGASNSQLVDAELALKALSYGEDAVRNSLEAQLKIEQEITKEKLNQVEVSNETLALYKVAKTEGATIARQIGAFLTGGMDYNQLKQMPRVLEAFKKYFPARAEAMEAAQYFGIPFRGEKGLGGGPYYGAPGAEIPTPEIEAARTIQGFRKRAGAMPTEINGLTINVTAQLGEEKGKKEIAAKIQLDIAEAIRTDPSVKAAIEERIEEY